ERDGEHPDQSFDERLARFEIERHDHRDVGLLLDPAPARREPGPELAVVVDLAVADRDHAAVGIQHRLLAVGEAAGRASSGAEQGAAGLVERAALGGAMLEAAEHGAHRGMRLAGGAAGLRVPGDDAADPAHLYTATGEGYPSIPAPVAPGLAAARRAGLQA